MKKVLLLVLDGWGYSEEIDGNAIALASTPNMDRFYNQYPWALLEASGEAVGLPDGQMGNSEVGHLNLGAGRIVYQELTRIGKSIEQGDFFQNEVLLEAMRRVSDRRSSLHLLGLVSDGGVHSHFTHLLALLEMAEKEEIENIYIHAILDGRDTVPFGARPFLGELSRLEGEKNRNFVATVSGRYYAMDRDRRWERTEKAYRAFTYGEGLKASSPVEALNAAYERGEGDEFVLPTVITDREGRPLSTIKSGDSVIFFNFRPDRTRQMTRAFIEADFKEFDRGDKPSFPYFVTMTEYDQTFNVPVAFQNEDLTATIGEVYGRSGYKQLRLAETEKYAHVTFFFSGGRENPFPGEDRILVPSPKVPTYDLTPEMSAPAVKREMIGAILEGQYDLIVANFANADMVGHTGDLGAAIRAVEAVDYALGEIVEAATARNWVVLICADHGNAEEMQNHSGEVLTAHSANPVPLIMIGSDRNNLRKRGILADVAPTILDLAGIETPPEMTGKSMIR